VVPTHTVPKVQDAMLKGYEMFNCPRLKEIYEEDTKNRYT